MQTENFFVRSLHWLWSNHKAIIISLGFYILTIVAHNLAINFLDSFEWYKIPGLRFLKLLKWMALIVFILSILSKIPYVRIPFITLGMSVFMLICIEVVCLVLYEYAQRTKSENTETETVKKDNGNADSGIFEKLSKQFAEKDEELPINDPVSEISPSVLGVDVLPDNLEQLKIPGEPEFRKQDPIWGDWQQGDTLFGYVNKPNAKVEMKSWNYGIQNPRAFYNFDSLGRRMNGNELKFPRKKYALFMGCSVTLGVLVDDKQTLPSIVERLDTTYRAYNYGVSGYGTHHVLAMLQNRNLRSEISEQDGIGFYVFFPGHINRAIGDMDSYLSWNSEGPFYYLDGDKVVHRKNFKEGRKLISRFYEFFSTTYICKYFDIHLPGKLRSHHQHFGAKLIEQAYREYQRQFGNDKFYVVLLPGWGNDIKPYLEEAHIKYLDYNRLLPYWQDKYSFQGDGHPRPLCYKVIAEQLDKDALR